MDTKQVIARFEAERQALALMDHPHIARVIDAGATESGRPYFVMELVRDIPITDYCDRERLAIRERLELFVQVCRAVQHAHQKGIIHRDLKPSNILVTVIDGAAVPKIIDFGVAKATGASLTDRTIDTAFHQFVGTPLYMSPEQADLSGMDVDTRSDIYSLGVLLYELLTGTTPFDQDTLRTAAFEEMRRIIREQEPPKPSTRISTLGATSSTLSTNRQTDPWRLRKSLRGELDWIVMKCLEKDRNRRYETANALVADLRRHLNHEPVEAGLPSASYRVRKFARRNSVALTAGTLVGVALFTGMALSTWQAVRATRAERESGRQSERARKAAEAVRDREVDLRHQAEDFANQSRLRQVRLNVEQGKRLMNDGDLAGSLPYFIEALHLDSQDPARVEDHRLRLGMLLAQCPKPARIWFHDQPIHGARFHPDGRAVAVAASNGTITVRHVDTGELIGPPLKHAGRVSDLGFSPDGLRLIIASGNPDGPEGEARVWEVATGRPATPPMRHTACVTNAFFGLDGRLVVTLSEAIRLWDAATGTLVRPPLRFSQPPGIASFSPDGRRLLVACGPGAPLSLQPNFVQVLDVATGWPLSPPLWREHIIHDARFSRDGRRLVTTTPWDGGALVGDLKPDDRPLEDLVRMAEVLSGARVDTTGAAVPIATSKLQEAYEALVRKDQNAFTARREQLLGWHHQQALACEAAGAWEAALVHLHRLIEAGPSIEALSLRRGLAHAELGHWQEAAGDLEIRRLRPQDGFYLWYRAALIRLASGDRAGYRAACARMLQHFGNAERSGEPADFTAWTCAVGPDALDDPRPALTLAERLHHDRPQDAMIAMPLGAMLYRAGRFAEAIAQLTEAEKLPAQRTSPIYSWLFLAMAHHRRGHADKARRWLDRAEAAIDKAIGDHDRGTEPLQFQRRLTLALLRAEAAALLGLADLPADVFARPEAAR
jgi:tetratricopeptide (TPR) repeat protein